MRRRTRYALLALGLLAAAGIAKILDDFVEDANFRRIEPKLAYRSAQVGGSIFADDWDEIRRKSGFRSVVNLRGANPGADWYRREQAFAVQAGIEHIDFALSAHDEPSLARMEDLVALLRAAPKPVLLHCNQGADRSGLAAALFVYAVLERPAAVAEKQLSLAYGHFPWLINRTGAMDRAFTAYVAAHPRPDATVQAGAPAAASGRRG